MIQRWFSSLFARGATRASTGGTPGDLRPFDLVPDAVVLVAGTGLIVYANQAAVDLFGAAPRRLEGVRIDALIPSATPVAWPDGEAWLGRRVVEGKRTDGGLLFLDGTFGAGRTRDERLLVLRPTAHVGPPVRQRLEESFLRTAIDGVADPIFAKDASGRYLLANRATTEVLNTDPIGRTDADLFGESERAAMRETDRRVLGGGETTEQVDALATAAGNRYFQTRKWPLRAASGQIVGVIGVARDITEQRAAWTALQRAQEQLDIALSVARAYHWSWDIVHDEITVSMHAADIIGHSLPARLRLADWLALLPDDDRGGMHRLIDEALRSEATTLHAEMRRAHPEKGLRTLELNAVITRDAGGRALQAFGIAQDVTDARRLHQELRDARDRAEQASAAKSRFLATASHDLRQPVQAALLHAASLHGDLPGSPARDTLDQLERGLDALKTLIDGLLDISRLEAGAVEPNIRDFHLAALFADLHSDYAAVAAAKGLRLTVAPCRAVVRSDPVLLARLLRNLLENALKYTDTGAITVDCTEEGAAVRVAVRDSGIGIAAADLARVWDEFHQVGNPERDRTQGLGLGLAIVKRLAQLLDHPVEARSAPGEGSVFSVLVPGGATAAPAPPAAAHRHPGPAGGGRVALLVEDDTMVLASLRAYLTRNGYRVLVAQSSAEAVATAGAAPPAVIVADYRLRETDTGVAAVEAVRAALDRYVPAVIVTGELGDEALEEAAMLGLRVLHKPVSPSQLLAALAHLSGAAGSGR